MYLNWVPILKIFLVPCSKPILSADVKEKTLAQIVSFAPTNSRRWHKSKNLNVLARSHLPRISWNLGSPSSRFHCQHSFLRCCHLRSYRMGDPRQLEPNLLDQGMNQGQPFLILIPCPTVSSELNPILPWIWYSRQSFWWCWYACNFLAVHGDILGFAHRYDTFKGSCLYQDPEMNSILSTWFSFG